MKGKIALVTGAASGLGFATAKAFGEAGASIVLADWDEDAVNIASQKLSDKGFTTLAIACDVSDEEQVKSMVEKTVKMQAYKMPLQMQQTKQERILTE
mgnify:CR=1 FL=1